MRAAKKLSIPINLELRGLALALCVSLSYYIVKFLGLEAAVVYELPLVIISSALAILGWGLNYFVSRDIIGTSHESAGIEVRNRLIVTILTLAVATALCMLCAVVQVSLPKLFKAHSQNEMGRWREVMRWQFLKVAVLSWVCRSSANTVPCLSCCFAAIARSCCDLLSVGLTSLRKDKYFIFLNLLCVFTSVAMITALVPFFGLVGAGIGALTTAIAVMLVGAVSVIKHSKARPT